MSDLTKISHIVTDNTANMLKAFFLPVFEDMSPDVINDDSNDHDDKDGRALPTVALDNTLLIMSVSMSRYLHTNYSLL